VNAEEDVKIDENDIKKFLPLYSANAKDPAHSKQESADR
jgi:hypothetical protein